MPIINNVRIVKFSSEDNNSCAEMDYFMTRKPLGNIQLYFDDKLLINITDQDHPDYDDIDFKSSTKDNPP